MLKPKRLKKYEDVISLAKTLAYRESIFLSVKEVNQLKGAKPQFYRNWLRVASNYPTIFELRKPSHSRLNQRKWEIGLVARAEKAWIYDADDYRENVKFETELVDSVTIQMGLIDRIEVNQKNNQYSKNIGEFSEKSRIWMERVSNGELAEVIQELQESLNQQEDLSVDHLIDLLSMKSRYNRMLQFEKRLEKMEMNKNYLEFEEWLEIYRNRLNRALMTLIKRISD